MGRSRNPRPTSHVDIAFDRTSSTFSIPLEIETMVALEDSESDATGNAAYKEGNETLCWKLGKQTAATGVDYNGHFGAQIILTLDADDDTPEERQKIVDVINAHLDWCLSLKLRPDVAKRRKEEAA